MRNPRELSRYWDCPPQVKNEMIKKWEQWNAEQAAAQGSAGASSSNHNSHANSSPNNKTIGNNQSSGSSAPTSAISKPTTPSPPSTPQYYLFFDKEARTEGKPAVIKRNDVAHPTERQQEALRAQPQMKEAEKQQPKIDPFLDAHEAKSLQEFEEYGWNPAQDSMDGIATGSVHDSCGRDARKENGEKAMGEEIWETRVHQQDKGKAVCLAVSATEDEHDAN